MIENLTTFITEAVKSTEGCQRNWDYDHVIPQEHIDTIVNTAITMPTKQNQEFYSLIVSTDRNFNYNFYLRTFRDEVGLYNDGRNAQTNASLLLIWVKNPNYVRIENSYEGAGPMNIGVSAGATALAANLLGYKSGFCVCTDKKVGKLINSYTGINKAKMELALGIGMPDETMPDRNYVKLPNGTIREFQKRTKNVKVYKI